MRGFTLGQVPIKRDTHWAHSVVEREHPNLTRSSPQSAVHLLPLLLHPGIVFPPSPAFSEGLLETN